MRAPISVPRQDQVVSSINGLSISRPLTIRDVNAAIAGSELLATTTALPYLTKGPLLLYGEQQAQLRGAPDLPLCFRPTPPTHRLGAHRELAHSARQRFRAATRSRDLSYSAAFPLRCPRLATSSPCADQRPGAV